MPSAKSTPLKKRKTSRRKTVSKKNSKEKRVKKLKEKKEEVKVVVQDNKKVQNSMTANNLCLMMS